MSLSAAENRIEIPRGQNLANFADKLEQMLSKTNDLKYIHRHTIDDGIVIEAGTEATLLTWGQEIEVVLREGEARIRVESPDQWIDWGKSKNTLREITKTLKDDLENRGRVVL